MTAFSELPVVRAPDQATWRTWLVAHHGDARGVFLLLPRRSGMAPSVSYDAAVEEALCFGWIDGRQQPDLDGWVRQHFAPRRPGSAWARSNKERIERLEREGRMTAAGRRAVEAARRDGSWDALDEIDALRIPDDLEAALALDVDAAAGFAAFSPSVKRAYLWWIKSAKRPHTRTQRVADTTWLAARGIREPRRRS